MKPSAAFLPTLLALALAGMPVLPVQAQALPSSSVDGIVAVVNEDVILRSELERAIANVTRQFANQPGGVPPRDVLERQVLERLILMRLQVLRAEDSGIRLSDQELQQSIAQIAQQNNMTTDQLRERLAADGMSFGEFQSNVREEMTVQRLRQRYIQSTVQVSEAEIDQLLATGSVGAGEVRLANIVVGVPDGATPEQVAEAKAKIDDVRAQIERGEIDFRSAAIR
jgi:peptidyl-prolyl cis-trans isomerase SurA